MCRQEIACVAATLAILALMAGAALAQTGDGFDLSWHVSAGGGAGGPLTGDGFALRATLGQTAIGSSLDATYEAGHGYWPGAPIAFPVFLPLLMKG